MSNVTYVGFDPGGESGVAFLIVRDGQARCECSCVSSVEAVAWASNKLGDKVPPKAIGIDSFLFWESGKSGWRAADVWLRQQYPEVRDSVLSSNSTFGSMAVQGMAFAIRAREKWPTVMLVETHSKVLYWAPSKRKYDWPSEMKEWLCREMAVASDTAFADEHCWDAALSAFAAHKGYAGEWENDLRAMSADAIEPAGMCSYWWPE